MLERRTPMKRSGFKRQAIERTKTVHQPLPEHLRRQVSAPIFSGLVSAPKTVERRNRSLLDMARGRPCLLRSPACPLSGDTSTTVACHSNASRHGKAGARKADDHYSVWGCYYCHSWLDQGHADRDIKDAVFGRALAEQLRRWRGIVADLAEPERFRRAAEWALRQHEEDARA